MSGMRKFQQTGGGAVSLSDLDRALRSVSSLDKLTVAPPLQLSRHGTATHLSVKIPPAAADTEFLLTFGQNAVIGDALTGDPWVTVDSDCTDVGGAFYLSAVADVDMTSVCLVPRCTAGRVAQPDQPDPPSCQLVWLGGLYQPCFIGGNGTPHYLSAGYPYIARATGQTLAAAIDLRDGDGTQNPDDPLQNVQVLNLPVYITGALPISLRCDGTTPSAGVGIPTL
jgi:hypothetical protein